jgi:transketolase
MRAEFVRSFLETAAGDPRTFFLTGDVGYKALEPIRNALGSRFINCGVAEQNMVGVAAGLAAHGARPWVYSIAPFVTARPYEFIRNDIAWHKLGVCIVGNGGGYGYGVMGPTHHALDDLALLAPHMRCIVPAFDRDVDPSVKFAALEDGPVYLRLGLGADEKRAAAMNVPQPNTPEHKGAPIVLALGPIVEECFDLNGTVVVSVTSMPRSREEMLGYFHACAYRHVVTLEEHQAQGGFGETLAAGLMQAQVHVESFTILAGGYLPGTYGDQRFMRRAAGIDAAMVEATLRERLRNGSIGSDAH